MTTPINSLPTPTTSSPNSPPIHFSALNTQLDTRLVPRFTTVTARNSAITAPVEGMACAVAGNVLVYRSGAWHGVSPISYSTTTVDATLYTSSHAIMTLSIPDPQYTYRINVGGAALLSQHGAGVGVRPSFQVNGVDQKPLGAYLLNSGGSTTTDELLTIPSPAMTGTMTGAATVTFFVFKDGTPGNGYQAQAAGSFGTLWATVIPS